MRKYSPLLINNDAVQIPDIVQNKALWVNWLRIDTDFKMQVCPRGLSGIPHIGNQIAAVYLVARRYNIA